MNEESLKHFYDALQAAKAIQGFAEDATFDEFCSDDLLSSAIERKFEIIGKALNRIKKKHPSDLEAISEFPSIIGFRNILVHGYDHVEDSVVWGIILQDLPELVSQLNSVPGIDLDD